jgi:hypothetical protein
MIRHNTAVGRSHGRTQCNYTSPKQMNHIRHPKLHDKIQYCGREEPQKNTYTSSSSMSEIRHSISSSTAPKEMSYVHAISSAHLRGSTVEAIHWMTFKPALSAQTDSTYWLDWGVLRGAGLRGWLTSEFVGERRFNIVWGGVRPG